MISGILVMYAALPVAALVVAFTIRYSPGEQQESAGSVLLSTLLSAFTISMWAYILAL